MKSSDRVQMSMLAFIMYCYLPVPAIMDYAAEGTTIRSTSKHDYDDRNFITRLQGHILTAGLIRFSPHFSLFFTFYKLRFDNFSFIKRR